MTLDQLIKELRVDDPSETARAVLAALKVSKTAAEILHTAVRTQVLIFERSHVRIVERSLRADGVLAVTPRDLHDSHFFTGTAWVSWAKATVEDHQGAVAWNTMRADALKQAAERHLWAITEIQSHGVTCLAEIGAAA